MLNGVSVEARYNVTADQSRFISRTTGRLDVFEGGATVGRVKVIYPNIRSV